MDKIRYEFVYKTNVNLTVLEKYFKIMPFL